MNKRHAVIVVCHVTCCHMGRWPSGFRILPELQYHHVKSLLGGAMVQYCKRQILHPKRFRSYVESGNHADVQLTL